MSEVALRVEGLGKRYRIGAAARPVNSVRGAIANLLTAPSRNLARLRRLSSFGDADAADVIWALRDISFELKNGEVLGFIGHNGAGKSTLLKILSRITTPSAGSAEIYGRVGSLLEVGTGFHPELTGRENIYLNGSILGMDRSYISRRFAEIVDFAGVGKFIDTPVKRYSSGMYVRLAFAVAAHLEPEILIVDEVLAVGDAAFQKQCLGKMGEVAREGRTVLFVSHNMVTVESLCTRALLLSNGRVVAAGDPQSVIRAYMEAGSAPQPGAADLRRHPRRLSGREALMTRVRLLSGTGASAPSIEMGAGLTIEVSFEAPEAMRPVLGLVIKTETGTAVFGINNRFTAVDVPITPTRTGSIAWHFDRLPLMPGNYLVDLYLGEQMQWHDLDIVLEAVAFEVYPADVFGTGKLPPTIAGPVFWDGRLTVASN